MNATAKITDFDKLASQVEKKFDEIFNPPASRSKKQIQSNHNLIRSRLDKLHKVLLSIEFRNTDGLLVKYLKQLEYLRQIFKHDKYLLTLLKLQYNLGIYIKTYKKNSHPIAFQILLTVFNRMCDIFYAKNMQSSDRVKIINKEIIRYNNFQKYIKNRARARKRKHVKSFLRGQKNILENLEAAVREKDPVIKESLIVGFFIKKAATDIKGCIRTELRKLRTELQVNTTKNKS